MSCTDKRDYLKYQKYPLTFKAELTVDSGGNVAGGNSTNPIESAEIVLTLTGFSEGVVIFNSPPSLNGVRFDVGNKVIVSYGEFSIPIVNGNENLIMCLFGMLSLKNEDLVGVSISKCNGIKLNIAEYKTDIGNVYVYLNAENSIPIRIITDYNGNTVVLNIINQVE